MNAPRTAPQAAPAQTTTAPAFDLDAALEEAGRALLAVQAVGGDTTKLTAPHRQTLLEGLSRALGLNPLSQPVIFLKTQGREVLYVTKVGTDQIAARARLKRRTIQGPELRKIAGRDLVFCQVEVTAPDGRSETATATLPLSDVVNDLMKAETKAKRRATLSLVGLGLLAEDELETMSLGDAPSDNGDPITPWLAALAKVETIGEIRPVYNAHVTALRVGGVDGRDAVRAWMRARGLLAVDTEATAVLSTMPAPVLAALDVAALEPGESPEPTPCAESIERAARAVRASQGDDHSVRAAWTILARSYGAAKSMTLRDAAEELKCLCETPETDPEPPTGTDGPAREPGSDDGDDGSAAAYEAHRAAQGERAQVTELRVVRDESSDPCVTSAAAWAAHLATERTVWGVRGAFRKRERDFAAEGMLSAREAEAVRRLVALGEKDPIGLLYCTTRREREASQRKDKAA